MRRFCFHSSMWKVTKHDLHADRPSYFPSSWSLGLDVGVQSREMAAQCCAYLNIPPCGPILGFKRIEIRGTGSVSHSMQLRRTLQQLPASLLMIHQTKRKVFDFDLLNTCSPMTLRVGLWQALLYLHVAYIQKKMLLPLT